MSPMHIVTLATCHNRKVRTLSAQKDLHEQVLPDNVNLTHVLVDDGSTDGTTQSVQEHYPDVEIVKGSGDLFWAGGMRHGWEQAVKQKEFDYLFVYNDDVHLIPEAIARLIETSLQYSKDGGASAHVVVGAFSNSDGSMTSYGGLLRASCWHPLRFRRVEPPDEDYITVDTMNMNGCLISKEALNKVGFLSEYFEHCSADYEYGLKLHKARGSVILASGYIGTCERNDPEGMSLQKGISFLESYRRLLSIKEQPLGQRFKYYSNYGGRLWPLLWLMPYITQPFKYIKNKYF